MKTSFSVGDIVMAISKHSPNPIRCVLSEEMIEGRMFRALKKLADGTDQLVGPFFISELTHVNKAVATERITTSSENISNEPKELPKTKVYISSKKRKRGFF